MVDLNAPTSQAAAVPGTRRIFDWLTPLGAVFGDGGAVNFGDSQSESASALEDNIVAPLADRGVVRATGIDADSFLQGQLSNDLRELTRDRAQLSSYNSPKGRVLAVFTLLRRPDAVWLETQRDLVDASLKRLRMFVLRSKLTLDDTGQEAVALGLAGPDAAECLASAGLPTPEIIWGCAEADGIVVMRRPGATPRYTVHGGEAQLRDLWPSLSTKARPVGTQAWRLLDLLAGLPAIHPETSDRHVAQMLNLDTLGGISFGKGCYPGQEIVARLHYLGNLKRRLFLGYTATSGAVRGAPVYASGHDAAIGEVLDFAAHPSGGQAVQVIVQLSHSEAAHLHVTAPDGPELTLAV